MSTNRDIIKMLLGCIGVTAAITAINIAQAILEHGRNAAKALFAVLGF